MDGVPVPPDTWIYVISPAQMPDGRLLRWYPPMPVAFNLIQAKRYRDRGVSERLSIMSRLAKRRDDEAYGPTNPRRAVDCIFDLQTAVLCAFLAIESFANHAVETLPDGKTITYKGSTLDKPAMIRIATDEKFKRVVPLLEGARRIAGDSKIWGRYQELKFLRDELVHIKQRGNTSDPDDPSAYDSLMLGAGDECVEAAIAVIEGAWPGFLPEHVREALT
jgi:hypothetical protein